MISFSCKKDSGSGRFNTISLAEIKTHEAEFSNQAIPLTDADGNSITKVGAIIFYKTSDGAYGKFQIKSIKLPISIVNWEWTIDMVNFNSNDGSISFKKQIIDTKPESYFDLDLGEESSFSTADFWDVFSGKVVKISPQNGALFFVYSN